MSSNEINEEAQGGREIRVVVDGTPEGTAPLVTMTGMRGMPVLITPYQSQNANGPELSTAAFQAFLLHKEKEDDREAHWKKVVSETRAWMTLLATIAASVTYQAGLNPPGGFWQADDGQGHHAGSPVLRDEHWLRYQAFYYLNAVAFVTSLAMIMALVIDRFFASEDTVMVLAVTACIDVASLIGAYAAGSTLDSSSTIFVAVITFVAFVGIIYVGQVIALICIIAISRFRCVERLATSRWCPVPDFIVEKAIQKKAERNWHPRVPV